jgi:transcriptional regulator of acetoin/glycerol metabolism
LNGTAVDGQPALTSAYRPIERCLRIGDSLLLPADDIHALRAAGVTVNSGLVIGPRLFHIYQRIARAAASSLTLHVTGESGSGKEHAARAFHNASPTSRGPFVAVNCATIPEGIAERLLFGAKRGAFSGVAADTTDTFRQPTAARCFSTRSPSYTPRCRPSSCACSRAARCWPWGR